MYVVVQHRIKDQRKAFARGEKLFLNEGASRGVRGLEFYPSRDGRFVTCLWEADSVETVQRYVDTVLGDSSENLCYELNAEQAFAERPTGISKPPSRRWAA